ncbi:MAG: hypothetical protein JWO95_2992 [Verrucomicrobiales bacterium]|nr:hypothetical protein [Verrucomicrobiales bacterium]
MELTKDMQAETVTELFVATDKVVFEGDHVLIHATEPMDWRIREFCKVPIWFRDKKYYLRSKQTGQPPRGVIYELVPWPEDLHGAESPQSIRYDEDYVIARNHLGGSVRRHDRFYHVLAPLYPFLGLAWSDFKNGTLARCGFDPQSITSTSIFLIFTSFILQSVFINRFGGGLIAQTFGRDYILYDWGLLDSIPLSATATA